jgi:flagellar hook-associated protein 1 FlgK
LLTESGEFTEDDATQFAVRDVDASTKRGIPYYQQALDRLAQKIASVFNRYNQNYQTDDTGYYYLDANGNRATVNVGGGTIELNVNMSEADIQNILAGANADDPRALSGNTTNSKAGVLFSDSGSSDDTSDITAATISVSKSWSTGAVRIVNSFNETVEGMGIPSTASDNIDRFIGAFSQSMDYYAHAGDTEPMFSGTFQEMLTGMSATLGNDIRHTGVLSDSYNASATELDSSRESVSGVDLNDEAMNLMTYQKSYQAACRLMTTVDAVLDKLINGTAV